jgi:hypothetical protein
LNNFDAFDNECEAFKKIGRLFEIHFQRNRGFKKKYEDFSKITRLFEDSFI